MKKAFVIISAIVLFGIFTFIGLQSNNDQSYAASAVLSVKDTTEKENPVTDVPTEVVDEQAKLEELAKHNPNIIPRPEYHTADEFVNSYIKHLNRENKEMVEATDDFTYELHVVTTASDYAKHFLALKDETVAKEKLDEIVDTSEIVFEKMKSSQLDEITLENAFNDLKKVMNG